MCIKYRCDNVTPREWRVILERAIQFLTSRALKMFGSICCSEVQEIRVAFDNGEK